ncbi:MAG: amino acid permease, partial [Thiovulaceae bacterium]|nr:amino acid permease [Sulfurimonadaceae bacterium]
MADRSPLARKITLPLLVFYGLGNILGAGIYVLIGKVAEIAGLYAPFAFLVALIVVGFTALSYMELSSRFPVAAGVAVYVQEGLHFRWLSLLVGITIALAGLISAAAIVNGFSGYLNELVDISKPLSITFLLFSICFIAIWGIGESVKIAAALTLLEIGGLLIIIWVGLPTLAELPAQLPQLLPSFEWES